MEIEDVENLEKITGQLIGLQSEMGALAKKSPNDGVNKFKLKFLNGAILQANEVLGEQYKPVADFDQFDVDDMPSNSDVTFILAQYLEELERFRADHVQFVRGAWYYDTENPTIRTHPPRKLK